MSTRPWFGVCTRPLLAYQQYNHVPLHIRRRPIFSRHSWRQRREARSRRSLESMHARRRPTRPPVSRARHGGARCQRCVPAWQCSSEDCVPMGQLATGGRRRRLSCPWLRARSRLASPRPYSTRLSRPSQVSIHSEGAAAALRCRHTRIFTPKYSINLTTAVTVISVPGRSCLKFACLSCKAGAVQHSTYVVHGRCQAGTYYTKMELLFFAELLASSTFWLLLLQFVRQPSSYCID
jgi:hypothetical protein